mmetsp:Transcript_66887/g.160140  ORF Transcript_66887/g.160140 Transcript_66887/m.160140 type:complete len:224 (+) Transcript_66887:119-790(+)
MKRSMDAFGASFSEPPVKMQNQQDGDNWVCQKCGNLNYPTRTHCNMRKCGAPRDAGGGQAEAPQESWICPGCGNENRPHRLFCNMRNCQMAKPGLTAKDLQRSPQAVISAGVPPPVPGRPPVLPMGRPPMAHQPMVNHANMPSPAPLQGKAPPPKGSWKCIACGNINFPERTVCNSHKCGKPRSEAEHPAGSWTCPSCGNVNWPNRLVCNGSKCSQARGKGGP